MPRVAITWSTVCRIWQAPPIANVSTAAIHSFSVVRSGSPGALTEAGRIERLYRTASIITFGGGTNEIQRDIIAIAGLGMPRPLR